MGSRQRVVKSASDLLLSPTLHQRLHYTHASLFSHHIRLLLFSLFFDFLCSSSSSPRCLLILPSFLSFSHWASRFGFFFFPFFFRSFSLGFWAWVLFFFLLFLSFFLHFSRYFSSFFPFLVLSKLYSVICCGVKGVGGVNGQICYGGLVWCFVICTMIVFFSWVLGLMFCFYCTKSVRGSHNKLRFLSF